MWSLARQYSAFKRCHSDKYFSEFTSKMAAEINWHQLVQNHVTVTLCGNVTSAGWQVTLCDPVWQVSSRSGVGNLANCYTLVTCYLCTVASTRVQGWGDEPCEPTVGLPDWSELVASYSRMKSAWGWANGGQPILVCYIQKYVIILAGIFPLTSPPTKILGGGSVPGIPGGVDASGHDASRGPSAKNFSEVC